MSKIWFALLGLLTLTLVAPEAGEAAGPRPQLAGAETALGLTPDDRILGNPNAPNTIVEYASLTCPHCAHFDQDVLPELRKKWIDTGKAKLVLRDFPLDQSALLAATVARCEPPDRFYGFVDTLFKNQEEWAGAKDPHPGLQRFAQLSGMGKKDFTTCVDDKAGQDKVVQSRFVA